MAANSKGPQRQRPMKERMLPRQHYRRVLSLLILAAASSLSVTNLSVLAFLPSGINPGLHSHQNTPSFAIIHTHLETHHRYRLLLPVVAAAENRMLMDDDTVSSPKSKKPSKNRQSDSEYETRRALWEEKYGSVEALRKTFGTAKSSFGDLDPQESRQLYHTLLPRSLLGLHEAGLMRPEELAPLAYQARVAAKEYTRERCQLHGRLLAELFDGYRSFRRNGTFQTKGLSWKQLWDKYEAQIVEEECWEELEYEDIDKEALATRIYLRILERSCATNALFNQMFLKNNNNNNHHVDEDEELGDNLVNIAEILDDDVREILLQPKMAKKLDKYTEKVEKKQEKIEKKVAKASEKERAKAAKVERKRMQKMEKARKVEQPIIISDDSTTTHNTISEDQNSTRRNRVYSVLRILAWTRHRLSKN